MFDGGILERSAKENIKNLKFYRLCARFVMDPNINKRDNYTALIEAARVNNLDIVKYLTGKDADVNVVASKNYGKETITAFDYAKGRTINLFSTNFFKDLHSNFNFVIIIKTFAQKI